MGATTRREQLETRWHMVLTDVARFKGENGIATVNSGLYDKVQDRLEVLGARLVDEVGDDEYDGLHAVTDDIWEYAKGRLIEWADKLEADREERRVERSIPHRLSDLVGASS